jgi:hypothetical protein
VDDVDVFRVFLLGARGADGRVSFSHSIRGMTVEAVGALDLIGWWDLPSAKLAEKGYLSSAGKKDLYVYLPTDVRRRVGWKAESSRTYDGFSGWTQEHFVERA